MENPGDYYRHKDELAHALRTVIRLIEKIQTEDPAYKYENVLDLLRLRLERAEYVGD